MTVEGLGLIALIDTTRTIFARPCSFPADFGAEMNGCRVTDRNLVLMCSLSGRHDAKGQAGGVKSSFPQKSLSATNSFAIFGWGRFQDRLSRRV
jgi:hypothetical protein